MGEVPEIVLDEPEQRVADDVVVEVICLFLGTDEADLIGAAIVTREPDRAAWMLRRNFAVGLRPGASYPHGVGASGEGGEGRHQPASPTQGNIVRTPLLHLERRPVGGNHGVPAFEQVAGVLL